MYKMENGLYIKKQSAFTIVELLVVIVVIGILATITIVSYTGISSKATVASLQSDLSSAKKQLTLYQVEHSAFPTALTNSGNTYCPSDDSKYCFKASSGTSFTNYEVSNTTNSQTFSMHGSKNNTYYRISNNSNPLSVSPAYATGGTVTTDGAYRIHTFTTNSTLTVTSAGDVEVLVVGGGGGGGGGLGGGGGGGGVVWIPTVFKDNNSYSIIVGLGGLGSTYPATSSNGQDSTVFGAIAKGGGGSNPYSGGLGVAGGSGGGAGATDSTLGGGGATVGSSLGGNIGIIYGNRGGHMTTARIGGPTRAAGGGGAGAQGLDTNCTITGDTGQYGAGSGGIGIQNAILGTNYYWGGGGGGGNYISGTGGYGGQGGGGGGGAQDGVHGPGGGQALNSGSIGGDPGGNGGANTGGGGGGSYWQPTTGGNGGSGIVIIRYLAP